MARPVRNLVRRVVTEFVGDPRGEAIAAPLAHDLGRQLSGQTGTIIHGASNPSSGTEFTGYIAGGLDVPRGRGTISYYRNKSAELGTSTSDEQSAYRAILAARLARNSR